MSYCRWSCEDYQCDIYCYESQFGFEIHVASNRVTYKEELPPSVPLSDFSGWFKRHNKVTEMLHKAERAPIGLAYDGESYTLDDAEECRDKLIALRNAGYKVPNYAIEALEEEMEA